MVAGRMVGQILRAVGKLTVPAGLPSGVLVLRGSGSRSRTVRFEDVELVLAEDAAGEDRLSGRERPGRAGCWRSWSGPPA